MLAHYSRMMSNRYGLTRLHLCQPLCSLLCDQPFPGLGLRLRLGAHDTTAPLLPDLVEFVVEVCLVNYSNPVRGEISRKEGNEDTTEIAPQTLIASRTLLNSSLSSFFTVVRHRTEAVFL